MTDREGLTRLTSRDMEDGAKLYITNSIDRPEYPRGNHAIRTSVFKGTLTREKDGDLYIEEFSQFNMGGYFPASLLNMVMSSIISKGVAKFRTQMLEMQDAEKSTEESSDSK